jgi:hypothetical protein
MSYQFEPAEYDRPRQLVGDRREAEEPPPQRLLTVAAALAVMAVFAGGLWFAYHEGIRHAGDGAADVPLIRADRRPMMVRPAEPGGLRIPDRNMLIYDPGKRLAEHLLPPPEQPMARPTAAAARVGTPPTAAAPTNSAASASLVPAPATGSAPAGVLAGQVAARPSGTPASSAAAAKPQDAAHGTPSTKSGNVRLQLGSVRSASAARLEWDRIRKRNSDLLAALSANAVRADLGGRGIYYRIETGPVGGLAANRICGELKQRKIGCVIVR